MNKSSQQINPIEEFYLAASGYCRLTEGAQENNKIDFLSKSQKILTLIYLKSSLLDKSEEAQEGEVEKFVQEEDWAYIQNAVASRIGTSDRFIEVLLPENGDPNNIESENFSDCFADIYQDLKDFVLTYEFGNPDAIKVSLSDCMINFDKIWGPKLLAVLVNIHSIINGTTIIDEEDELMDENNDSEHKSSTSNWLINQRFNQEE